MSLLARRIEKIVARVQRYTRAAGFKVTCRGCGAWLESTSVPEEAGVRIMEFARDHAEHFRIPIDDNGFATIAYGVQRGGTRRAGAAAERDLEE